MFFFLFKLILHFNLIVYLPHFTFIRHLNCHLILVFLTDDCADFVNGDVEHQLVFGVAVDAAVGVVVLAVAIFEILGQTRTRVARRQNHVDFLMDSVEAVAPSPSSLRRRPVDRDYFFASLVNTRTPTTALPAPLRHLIVPHVPLRHIIHTHDILRARLQRRQRRRNSRPTVRQLNDFFHDNGRVLYFQKSVWVGMVDFTGGAQIEVATNGALVSHAYDRANFALGAASVGVGVQTVCLISLCPPVFIIDKFLLLSHDSVIQHEAWPL